MSYRIVHADRSASFHNGVKRVFADNPNFDFVDHCGYLEQALESLDIYQPNLLLTASNLYDTRNAVQAFCGHRELYMPEMKIIVLTMVTSLDFLLNGLIKGVDGYLTKEATADDIFNCVLEVSIGDRYLTVPEEVKRRTKE
jgi:DNA-binding NarL/FixJ family response regulator